MESHSPTKLEKMEKQRQRYSLYDFADGIIYNSGIEAWLTGEQLVSLDFSLPAVSPSGLRGVSTGCYDSVYSNAAHYSNAVYKHKAKSVNKVVCVC